MADPYGGTVGFRMGRTITTWTAEPFVPDTLDLARLEEASMGCKGCPLYKDARQTVFGSGPIDARIVLIGEQPGDKEDIEGEPFVGPAGRVLNEALIEAGLDRDEIYLTNAVKHFKWIPASSGTRRLHAKPRWSEVQACRPWLSAELAALRPEKIGLLGSTAAQSLFGRDFRVTQTRGQVLRGSGFAEVVVATVHPSSILRSRSSEERKEAFELFVSDLVKLREAAASF